MTELEQIMEKTELSPNECSCQHCQDMCKRCPCMGTPQDILRLINNGYGQQLQYVKWAAGLSFGYPVIDLVAPLQKDDGSCTFLDAGRCTLHATGLKPTEGVIATCDVKKLSSIPKAAIAVASTWTLNRNARAINLAFKYLIKLDEKEKSL